jgi:hypothetical protein
VTSAGDLLAHAQPDLVDKPDKFIGQYGLLAASPAVERNGKFMRDAAGMSRHDEDALRQIDRLVEIVGDHHDGLALRSHSRSNSSCMVSRVCESSAPNGLVKQQDLGIVSQREGYGDAVRVARQIREHGLRRAMRPHRSL